MKLHGLEWKIKPRKSVIP